MTLSSLRFFSSGRVQFGLALGSVNVYSRLLS